MAAHKYQVLSDNCTLGNKGQQVNVDDEVYNVPALVTGGHLKPVGQAAKEAAADE